MARKRIVTQNIKKTSKGPTTLEAKKGTIKITAATTNSLHGEKKGTKETGYTAISDYKCKYCEEEITSDLIKDTMGSGELSKDQDKIINSILPYLNKYRKDFGLDTCLRKAHFIAQTALESKGFTTFEEDEGYSSSALSASGIGDFSSNQIVINDTIVNSLKENLGKIFKIIDEKGVEIPKSNEELKTILLEDKPTIIDGELYGSYKGEKNAKNKKIRTDKLIKTVLDSDKNILYKIYIKPHTYFGLQVMSRAYAGKISNGDELSRDGWKFKGRGIKQITGKGNYKNFGKYRTAHPFPEDNTGAIDFTAEKEGKELEGNYLKLSDDGMYATQSALWFWNEGNKYNGKTAKGYADEDDVEGVSKAINFYDTKALPRRKKNYNNARKAGVFDIDRHYKLMLENGDEKQKTIAKAYLEQRKKMGDKEADANDKNITNNPPSDQTPTASTEHVTNNSEPAEISEADKKNDENK